MRRTIACGLAVWLVAASLLALPSQPAIAQDGATLGDAPYLEDGMVIAAAGDDIVQAAAVPAVDISSRSSAAAFFFSYYTGQPAIGWTGSQASCNAGTTSSAFKSAVIDRVAFYRAMAGVPSSVGLAATNSTSNQQAALMFSRNNQLSHTPPSSWACYTAAGAQAAGSSNIALGTYGVSAIDAYMKDAGSNNAAAGHRRWILYPQTQSFGTGDVPAGNGYPSANSLWVWDSNVSGPRPSTRDGYVAWPPPGYVPYQVVFPRWTFSYPGAGFGGASVSVTLNGSSVPVTIDSSTATGYGENTIVFRLNGMSPSGAWGNPGADQTYTVRITGASVGGQSRTFTYNVTIFDPSSEDPGPGTSTATRTATRTPTSSPTRTATRTATGIGTTAVPSTTRTATRTPTTISGGYAVGERFRLTASVNLRSGPGTGYSPIAVVPSGTIGTVTGPPVLANGYTFYPVSITGYSPGWVAGEFFARVATATPTRTATAGAPTATRTPTTTAPTVTRTPTTTAPTVTRTATRQVTATRIPGGFVAGDTVRTTASVNFRSGPSTSSSVITVVAPNTTGTITGAGVVSGPYTYYPLTIPGVGSGWIAGQYLALVSGGNPTATVISGFPVGATVYTTTGLNIRTGPGTGYSSRGVAPRGTSAIVTGASVRVGSVAWYPLQVSGIGAGWASGAYLSLTPTVLGPQVQTAGAPTETSTFESTLEPTLEPTAPPTEAPPSETPIPTATATIVDVLTPTEIPLPTETPEILPTEPQATVPEPPTETPELQAPPEETLWLPIARIQRSPDSQPGQVLVDSDPSTVWFANGAGQPLAMFVLDLGQVSAFSQIQWLTGESGIGGTLYLSISSDNVEWIDLDPTLANINEDGWVTLDVPASAQFIRFVFVNDTASDWLGGVSEVRISP
jgi:uncharacterized protein YraI